MNRREPLLLLGVTAAALLVAAVEPYDRTTWLLEVFPVLLGAPILVATHARFPLTPLLYRLLCLHALILIVGGHYTYARVPLGFWAESLFDLSRNHYDRLGHFAQGFVPAILAREILLRRSPLRPGRWLFFLVTCVCLAVSAVYELIEWWAALLGGEAAESFLGTQGDVWDTQWDMFLALIGSIASQLLLSREHDAEIARLRAMPALPPLLTRIEPDRPPWRWLFRLPSLLYRANLGWLLGERFVELAVRGRRTGLERRIVVEVIGRDEPTGGVFIASAWGTRAQWFRNLRAHPRAEARSGRRRFRAEVSVLEPGAASRVLAEYARAHSLAYRWFIGPLLLGHRPTATPDEFDALARAMPVLLVRAESR